MDGRVVSAAAEESFARVPGIGYARTGGFPHAAVTACLESARLEPEDVQQIVVVDDGASRPPLAVNGRFRGVPMREIAAERADAIHAASASSADVVMVCGADPAVMALFRRKDGGLGPRVEVGGADGLVRAARKIAATLGLGPEHGAVARDPFASVDRLSVGADPEFQAELAPALRWSDRGAVEVDDNALEQAIARVSGDYAPSLADASSLNERLHQIRRKIAASFTCQIADIVSRAARQVSGTDSSTVAVGGGLFANARFNSELGREIGVSVAPVPEALGRAVGAVASESIATPPGLALGPSFSEEEIKRTLDNCRLDYVYEPDWVRLLTRVSRMLSQGKVVGWFQGPMAFGPRALGTRSILADPSSRYARHNMNEYLRQTPIDEPLPVALAPSMARLCLARELDQSAGVIDAEVRAEWRTPLIGALDWRHHIRVHGSGSAVEPRLGDLLESHYAATRTPGLIETNLAGPGEPTACSPRDAVRAVYSSAIDALVIGRFLLMKDYWLLRNQDQ